MKVRHRMVMVPNNPKELRVGMLCRSVSDDSEPNSFYLLDDGMDIMGNGLHESVIPFIVSKDGSLEMDEQKIYLFNFEDGGSCIAKPDELFDKGSVLSFHELVVAPEQIGLIDSAGSTVEIGISDLNRIMADGGFCNVEMDDEFTAPDRFTNVGWGDSVPELRLIDGKCLISFDC